MVAIGNPFGLDRTVTSGIVSALQRQIQAPNGFSISHVIQTDAAINPGNSGGPLIDAEGRVVGINSQIETGGGGGNVGIGFAIPINTAREVAEQLEQNGEVEHAYLGISGGTITPDLAQGAQPAGRRRACSSQRWSRAARPTRPGSKAATPKRRSKARASPSAATSSPRSTARRSPSMEELVERRQRRRSPATRSK